jgi:hypothetical protein
VWDAGDLDDPIQAFAMLAARKPLNEEVLPSL